MDIVAHMEVVDVNGQHVGTVESVDVDKIKLVEADALDKRNLFVERSVITKVDENKVHLSHHISTITTRSFLSSEG